MKLALTAMMTASACVSPGQPWSDRTSMDTRQSTVVGESHGYTLGVANRRPEVGELQLATEQLVFFKNLEIQGSDKQYASGETFIGFLAPTRLRYRSGDRTSIEIGVVPGSNFGDDDDLDVAEPLVRLAIEVEDDVHLIAGTLIRSHWAHDALLDDVEVFRSDAEQGIQVRLDKQHYKGDHWLNWRERDCDPPGEV